MNPASWKRLLLALWCIPLLTLSGCWDVKDINKRYLPVVMGVDEGEKEAYRVILQIPTVRGGTQILEDEAKSISKAIDQIRTKAEKSIDLLHLRLFLISERLAKKGIGDVVDFAIRADDISIKGMVGIVQGKFEKTLYHQVKPTPEVSSYDYFSEESGWTPSVTIDRLWEAYRSIHSYTEDMPAPLIEAGTDTLFIFKGSAIMQGDKMIGMVSPDETMILNVFQEKYTGGTIEVAQDTSVLIKKAKVRHEKSWTAAGPRLKSSIALDIVVTESKEDESNEEIARKIKQLIEMRAAEIVLKLHKLKSDTLSTGQIFRPMLTEDQLKNWKTEWYPKLKHEISCQVRIRDSIYFKET
ncbi:Ger(x)C family spore germination protein [Paenibacillus hodogayensis]|uniref:Ger(X)C family spore germination protein n=1 Tax=Paenibacillus hodogayensis TaxID=279208 RepID=A0ABV5W709_9BACL